MHLYNLTLTSATAITHATLGEFSGRKGPKDKPQYEIVASKGRLLELIRPDTNTGQLNCILSIDVFGNIRSLAKFRSVGGSKDYIVIGSDSGCLTILEYLPDKNCFSIVYNEIYGRSGARRIVPGQYLATDPSGRAVMIGAVEKEKRVYILNRDTQARLALSSPLDAQKANTIIFYMVGIDVVYENPMFACLELDYEEANEDPTGKAATETRQTLTFYELDLGLCHVVRKYSEPLERNANMLIAVPGGEYGPSGILVCFEDYIVYKNFGEQKDVNCRIPGRSDDDSGRSTLIISSATNKHKNKKFRFFIVQTEYGDLFKLDMELDSQQTCVIEMKLTYFDTIAPSTSLCFLPSGFLFAAAEFGNHFFYQAVGLADSEDEQIFSSADLPKNFAVPPPDQDPLITDSEYEFEKDEYKSYSGLKFDIVVKSEVDTDPEDGSKCSGDPATSPDLDYKNLEKMKDLNYSRKKFEFVPRKKHQSNFMKQEQGDMEEDTEEMSHLVNLNLLEEMDSLAPIITSQVVSNLDSDTDQPASVQIITACGRGQGSTLRILRHGLRVTDAAAIELEGNPTAVWSLKKRIDSTHDDYIVVSFINATVVLGFVEVVGPDGQGVKEEVGPVDDSNFLTSKPTLGCGQIGDADLVQIHPDGIRHIRSGLRVNEWRAPGRRQIVRCTVNQRQVAIVLSNGEIIYFEMDTVTGQLNELNDRKIMSTSVMCMALGQVPYGEQRFRFLAVGLADSTVRILSLDTDAQLEQVSIQVLPSPPESLCLIEMGSLATHAPLNPNFFDSKLEQLYLNIGLQNGVLFRTALDKNSGELSVTRTRYLGARPLQLFNVCVRERQALFAATDRSWLSYYHHNRFHLVPLHYERLEFVSSFSSRDVPEGLVAVTENTLRVLVLEQLGVVFNQQTFPLEATPRRLAFHPQSRKVLTIEVDRIPRTRTNEGDVWRSFLRVMCPSTGQTHQILSFAPNECLTSLSLVSSFRAYGSKTFVLIGVARNHSIPSAARITQTNRDQKSNYILTYELSNDGKKLQRKHETFVDGVPQTMCAFDQFVAIGIGSVVRIYDMGLQRLLTKCESPKMSTQIVTLSTHGQRLVVGDAQDGFTFMKFSRSGPDGSGSLKVLADDIDQRFVVCAGIVDHSTIAAGDKFGNISVVRLPPDVNDEVDDNPTDRLSLWDRGWLGGASKKAESIANFHLGDIVSSIRKISLSPGFLECLLYTTIAGAVGVLIPLTNHEDIDFFQKLEASMRQNYQPLCGRNHAKYRSFLFPVKNVIDGDLCDLFSSLDVYVQQQISKEMDLATSDISLLIDQVIERII